MNSTKQTNKFTRFLRNHAALLILVFCVLAISAVVLAVTLSKDHTKIPDSGVAGKPGDNDDDNPGTVNPPQPTTQKIYFISPVKYTSIGMEFTDGEQLQFVFNSTLNYWATHNAVDLAAADGTEVVAMYDGTVIEVDETYGMGNYVKVDHGNNVVVTYASLGDVTVQEGQQVKQGDKLGAISTSASYEFLDGAHLHLEVTENGKTVDPTPYVNGEIFREVEVDS